MAGSRQVDMAQRVAGPRALESTMRIVEIAKEAGMSPVTLATAWSKQHDFVASTIVGVSKEEQLDDIFAAIDLTLSAEVMTAVHKVTKEILYPMG
jgi:aryl-alcohol dehydrogenase-like predicted oxidoreductase